MTKLFQNYKRAAVEFVKAEGNYLFDQDGKKYLDFSTGIGVTNLGFHPEVKAALQKQAEEIWHTPNLYLNSLQEEVADKLIGNKDYLAFFAIVVLKPMKLLLKLHVRRLASKKSLLLLILFMVVLLGQCPQLGKTKLKLVLVMACHILAMRFTMI